MSNIRRIMLALLCATAFAPSRVRAQTRAESLTTSYDVGGIRVIHRRATASDIVVANLYLLGGSRQLTFANAGIEPLLLAASERGSAHFSREQLRRQLARTGSTIVMDVQRDWSMIGLHTTLNGFRETWPGFADRVMAPKLDSGDVAIEREEAVTGLIERRESPDDWAEHLADSISFAGHAYGVDPVGTERSVASLTSALLRAYHREQFVKSRMLLVIVGNVARSTVDSLVTKTLATLPVGGYRWTLPDTIARRPTAVVRDGRSIATNYLIGYAPGPRANDPDYEAMRVACAILSGRLFAEVRSRQTLTYAVNAPFVEHAVGAVGLYVSTNEPVAALNAMRQEIRALQENQIDGRAMGPLVQEFITEYFLSNETSAAQANFLVRAELYEGDWHKANAFSSTLHAVSPADVQRVMQKYFRDINFAYVGDPAKLPASAIRGF